MDTTAFDENNPESFVARFRTPILAKARRRLWVRDLAEDVCQETMLRVVQFFRSGKRLDDPACLASFVLTVCDNVIHEVNRKNRDAQISEGWEPAYAGPDPHSAVVTKQREELVWKILSKLRANDRELLMAVLQETGKAELCRRFGVTEEYLRVIHHRARRRFAAELRKMDDSNGPKKK